MGWMAGNAQRRFLVYVRDAIEDAATARRIGVPGIARPKDIVEGGRDGQARIGVWWRIVHASAQLVFGMIGPNADVIGPLLFENARGELVARQRLHFVRQSDRIFAVVERDRFPAG